MRRQVMDNSLNSRISINEFASIGCRDTYEDAYFSANAIINEKQYGCFAVADGMGGHEFGEVASYIATQKVTNWFNDITPRLKKGKPIDFEVELKTLVTGINKYIWSYGKKVSARLGTTLSMFLIDDRTGWILHAGDSSIWLLDKHHPTQLTTSHCVTKNGRQYLTSGLGIWEDLKSIEIKAITLERPSRIFLASDGMTNKLDIKENISLFYKKPEESVLPGIYNIVRAKGESDNATGLIVNVL